MKKFAALLIAGLMIVSLAACGNKTEDPAVTDTTVETTEVSTAPAETTDAAETTTTDDETSSEPTDNVEAPVEDDAEAEVSPAA